MSAQTTHLKRVRSRIGETVKTFCRRHVGESFWGRELHEYVASSIPQTAPGSADRILRDLRQRGEVQYTVLSRGGSVYHIEWVEA